MISGDNSITSDAKIPISKLTLECNLIHKVISNSILPRSGSRDHVSYTDVCLLWCMRTGT